MSSSSVRLSEDFHTFITRLAGHRVPDIDCKILSQEKITSLIVKYFKENNDRYLELVNMENKQNV